jgi:hypothetical protein
MVPKQEVRRPEPEVELVVVGVALDLAGEEVARGGEVADLHGSAALVVEMEWRVRLQPREALGDRLRLRHPALAAQHRRHVRQGDGIGGLELEHVGENLLSLLHVPLAGVDHAQRVVGGVKGGIVADRGPDPPVRVVDAVPA